jgi:hypothetical protein
MSERERERERSVRAGERGGERGEGDGVAGQARARAFFLSLSHPDLTSHSLVV